MPQSTGRPAARAGLRALIAIAAAVAFLLAARLADPAATSAESQQTPPQVPAPEQNDSADDEAFMGAIEGADFSVRLYATRQGPRYSVIDAFGHVVASGLYADEVHAYLPGYDIQSMQADEPDDALLVDGPLMLADYN